MATAKKSSTPARKSAAKPAARPATAAKKAPSPAAKPKAAAPAPAAPKPGTEDKPKKSKLVRDSFTIPKIEYMVLDELKQRAARAGSPAKKSEILRAGIKALAGMSDAAFVASLRSVPAVKTGRPAKD
jgi:hypothetical protein